MASARAYCSSIGYVSTLPISHICLINRKDDNDLTVVFRDRGGARNCGSGPFYQWKGFKYALGFRPAGINRTEWKSNSWVYTGYQENLNDYYFYVIESRMNGRFSRYQIIGERAYQDGDDVFVVTPDFTDLIFTERSDIISLVRTRVLTWVLNPQRKSWSYRELVVPAMECKFQEYETFLGLTEFNIYLNGSASRFQAAYVDAYTNLPQAATNSMANVVATLDIIKDMITKGPLRAFLDGLKDLRDVRNAWLSYRYVYTTTKLDVEEYREFLLRVQQLRDFTSQIISCAGHYSDDTGSYRCEIGLALSQVLPTGLSSWLSKCGFNLTATNIWDMIPYSFVVDWFIGVSDLTSYLENWSGALELSPSQIWLTYMNEYDGQHYFYRVPGTAISVPPAYHDKVVSQRTFTMRCADTISLFSKR